MKAQKLMLIVCSLVAVVSVRPASGREFFGSFTGLWTVGVPEANIMAGDTFTWDYRYESPQVDGLHDVTVFRTDIPSVLQMDAPPQTSSMTVASGHVGGVLIDYHFSDPRFPLGDGFATGLFIIDDNSFRGFGQGTVSYLEPVPVPEPSIGFYVALALGYLLLGKRFPVRDRPTYRH